MLRPYSVLQLEVERYDVLRTLMLLKSVSRRNGLLIISTIQKMKNFPQVAQIISI
jgi:hypothetical protein